MGFHGLGRNRRGRSVPVTPRVRRKAYVLYLFLSEGKARLVRALPAPQVIRTMSFPKLRPFRRPAKASGAFSSPSTISSR